VEYRHLQHEHDKYKHQGSEYAAVYFEELTHFTESQFWYLNSRLRTTCGIKPYLRATCNPDSDSFVAELIEWWIDQNTGYPIPERAGVERWFVRPEDKMVWGSSKEELLEQYPDLTPRSFTFIPGKLSDNAILATKDPGYRGRLQSLQLVERERLLGGNWKIRPAAGLYFRRGYFEIVDSIDPGLLDDRVVRFWDKAATEATGSNDPSWTVGVKMACLTNGKYAVLHVERFRGTPGTVDKRMRAIATQDGHEVMQAFFQDPAQAGVVDKDHTKRVLTGYPTISYKVTKSKIQMAGPVSAQAEGGNIVIVNGPWVDDYLNELEGFPDIKANDQVDATSGAYQMLLRTQLNYR
jgi:predicted phage terminase large subunit-like protein